LLSIIANIAQPPPNLRAKVPPGLQRECYLYFAGILRNTTEDDEMRNLHEYVYYTDGLPIRVFVHNQSYIPPHWHKEIEILLVLSGCVQVAIGQMRVEAKEGDVVIVNCNEIHSTSTNDANPLIIMGLQVDPEFCGILLPDIARIWFRNCSFLESGRGQTALDWMRYYLARILWETIEMDEGYQVALQGMVYLIISYLTRNCRQNLAGAESLDIARDEFRGLRPILDYIDSHYMEKLSMHEIAESRGMSHYYLSHLFKAQIGVSFGEYVTSIRIAKALDLLAYSDQKIIDIIYTCGFSGPDFFYKTFKEKQHCTPLEYRQKYHSQTQATRQPSGNFDKAGIKQNTVGQVDAIVGRLFKYLEKLSEDRVFSNDDQAALISMIRKNNPRQMKYFSSVHFNLENPG
jgi:xylan 1,4-beta-xylosidase